MIGLDTNILARYYVDDANDQEAQKQQLLAREIIESSQNLMVCKTILLELEWVMRGYYGFDRQQISQVLLHLLGLTNVHIEDKTAVEKAVQGMQSGIDFADALHHASYQACQKLYSFDDKKFAQKVNQMAMLPRVTVPK